MNVMDTHPPTPQLTFDIQMNMWRENVEKIYPEREFSLTLFFTI